MKGSLLPVSTPFSLAHGPTTPNTGRTRSASYFAESHNKGASLTASALLNEGRGDHNVEELLVEKLEAVAVASASDKSETPINTIPPEILALVLEHGYLGCVNGLPDSRFRALTTAVSRKFRAVALDCPALWSIIYLSPSNVFDEVDILPLYLKRSKSHPLDIHMNCFWASDLTEQVMDLLTPHSKRWRELSITSMNDDIFSYLQDLSAPFLRALTIAHYSNQRHVALPPSVFQDDLPRLEFLCLRNVGIDNLEFSLRGLGTLEIRGYGQWPTFQRLKEMIGGSHRLQRLVLHVKPAEALQQLYASEANETGITQRANEQITLPGLTMLEIHSSEWLTPDIADFLRVFVCPNLQSLVLQESVGSPHEKATTIVSYSTQRTIGSQAVNDLLGHSWTAENIEPAADAQFSVLKVTAASVFEACRAVHFSAASTLTTLELHRVFWTSTSSLKTMFASLKSLAHLLIFDLVPNEALSLILETTNLNEVDWSASKRVVEVPTLRTLALTFITRLSSWSHIEASRDYTKEFVDLFAFPSLSSLILKSATVKQWEAVAASFLGRPKTDLNVKNLKLVNITEALPSDADSVDIGGSFPKLKSLSLRGTFSNCFILPLSRPSGVNGSIALLDLDSLWICDDANASRPLLHQTIALRKASGRPLKALYLDSHFMCNRDSWDWMGDQVGRLVKLTEASSLITRPSTVFGVEDYSL